jgi:hypothetical protein
MFLHRAARRIVGARSEGETTPPPLLAIALPNDEERAAIQLRIDALKLSVAWLLSGTPRELLCAVLGIERLTASTMDDDDFTNAVWAFDVARPYWVIYHEAGLLRDVIARITDVARDCAIPMHEAVNQKYEDFDGHCPVTYFHRNPFILEWLFEQGASAAALFVRVSSALTPVQPLAFDYLLGWIHMTTHCTKTQWVRVLTKVIERVNDINYGNSGDTSFAGTVTVHEESHDAALLLFMHGLSPRGVIIKVVAETSPLRAFLVPWNYAADVGRFVCNGRRWDAPLTVHSVLTGFTRVKMIPLTAAQQQQREATRRRWEAHTAFAPPDDGLFARLPDEMLVAVFGAIREARSFVALASTCQRLRRIGGDRQVLNEAVKRVFHDSDTTSVVAVVDGRRKWHALVGAAHYGTAITAERADVLVGESPF